MSCVGVLIASGYRLLHVDLEGSGGVPAMAPGVDAELKSLLRRVKLGRLLDTLPERLALARTEQLPHADFLSLLLADAVGRRDRSSAELRAHAA